MNLILILLLSIVVPTPIKCDPLSKTMLRQWDVNFAVQTREVVLQLRLHGLSDAHLNDLVRDGPTTYCDLNYIEDTLIRLADELPRKHKPKPTKWWLKPID